MDSGFQVLNSRSFSVDLGFRIAVVSGVSGFLQLYFGFEGPGFHKQKFPGFPHIGRFFYIFLYIISSVKFHMCAYRLLLPDLVPQGCDPAISNSDACFAGKE